MPDWSLEGELRKAAGADNVESALRALNLLPTNQQLAGITLVADWTRGGAESYIFRFDVRMVSGLTVPAIIKAHTPPIGPQSIEKSLSEMLRRRHLLADAGLRVPSLYYSGNGIIIEQYIPLAFGEYFSQMSPGSTHCLSLATELIVIALVLDECGFAPIDVIGDLRADDNDYVYMIDFGEDLGPPNIQPNHGRNEKRFREWLDQQNLSWPHQTIRKRGLEEIQRRRLP